MGMTLANFSSSGKIPSRKRFITDLQFAALPYFYDYFVHNEADLNPLLFGVLLKLDRQIQNNCLLFVCHYQLCYYLSQNV